MHPFCPETLNDPSKLQSGQTLSERANIPKTMRETRFQYRQYECGNNEKGKNGGEPGIRTPGGLLTHGGFQDRCFKPLSQLTGEEAQIISQTSDSVKEKFNQAVISLLHQTTL